MRVLSLVHQWDAASGVFGDAVAEAGYELVERNVAEEGVPGEDFDAVLVFGGAVHVDQEDRHGWLKEEDSYLRRLLRQGVPVLGVCLGGQLLAKALDAQVRRMPSPEVGWYDVELTAEAADDPVLGGLPGSFETFQWHSYAFELPGGAVALARNSRCLQAYRAGAAAWGLQFHAEVTRATVDAWIESSKPEDDGGIDFVRLRSESDRSIGRWNELGKEICRGFLTVAERATARGATTRATSPRSS